MTTTEASLDRAGRNHRLLPRAGLHEIFLRPLSRTDSRQDQELTPPTTSTAGWRSTKTGLDYILELNDRGVECVERYAAIMLKKMLTNDDPGYVDLTSPAGIGIGALVYNYDGDVYASDEGRMLAEMGDTTFRLGNVHSDSYEEMHPLRRAARARSRSRSRCSAPMCSDCAFEPYCGADPVFHHATQGDFLGRKAVVGVLPSQHGRLQASPRALRDQILEPARSSEAGPADDPAPGASRPRQL